ncbi:hypothetical protein MBLNU13_g02152t1 [Cladosporium sp. NU13]
MCSNKNNNRTHCLGYYVTEVNGKMVDRRTVTDPVLRVAGMPARIIPAEQPADAADLLPLAGDVLPADAAAIELAQIPLADKPREYKPIPAFNAGPTFEALREAWGAALKKQARANREAIETDRASRIAHKKQVRKLRSYKAAKENAAVLPQLPQVARSNAEGLTAAKQLTAQQAPRQIFSQESLINKCRQCGHNPLAHDLVKVNIWRHSRMVTEVDLRDDKARSYDGNTIRRGAIYEPETADNCAKVDLRIWVEMASNRGRALWEFRRVARYCPRLRSLRVEVVGENNLQVARDIAQILIADYESGEAGFGRRVRMEFDASLY